MSEDNDFFEKNGLEVAYDTVEVGKTYPVYGMITDILDSALINTSPVKCVINFNMLVEMNGITKESFATIKDRALEPGIFITTIEKYNKDADNKVTYQYEGACSTVVFGKKQLTEVQ